MFLINRKAQLKRELEEDKQEWSRENVQQVKDPNKNSTNNSQWETDHDSQIDADYDSCDDSELEDSQVDSVHPEEAAVENAVYRPVNHQVRGYHGNSIGTFHGDCGDPQRSQGREFGPVYGVEDRRKNIWRSIPRMQY